MSDSAHQPEPRDELDLDTEIVTDLEVSDDETVAIQGGQQTLLRPAQANSCIQPT